MFANNLVIDGVLVKDPEISQSPAGIPHCRFVLEHQSEQVEAEFPRRVWCRIKVIASGMQHSETVQYLKSGSTVRVHGFINRIESHNGLAQLILHARQIENF